jgi:hypothetical protein
MFDESIQDLLQPFCARGACGAYIGWMRGCSRARFPETILARNRI